MGEFLKCKVCENQFQTINKKYNLVQCDNCKLIFCATFFTQENFVSTYNKLYNSENAVYKRHAVIEYKKLLNNKKINVGYNRNKLIKKHILNNKCNSVLEIGSGIGLIGHFLRNKNSKIDYLGIEIDKVSYEKSRTLQLNTINADFKAMANINQSFDVIMLWEVLEHLQDLNLFIELAHKKLNKGGKIILSTPNYNKIYNYPKRLKDAIYQDEPPIHLNFFTTQNIINIFNHKNFDCCKASVKKYPYLRLTKIDFYKDIFKIFKNQYNGSTIYFEATKK